jgi:hypothetical protein
VDEAVFYSTEFTQFIEQNIFPNHADYHCDSGTSAENLAAESPTLDKATLDNVIQYALKHQPLIQQSVIDQRVVENTIKSKLADWYPQINFNYNLQHNFAVQTSIIGGNPVKLGVDNTSAAQFSLTQVFLTVICYWQIVHKTMFVNKLHKVLPTIKLPLRPM